MSPNGIEVRTGDSPFLLVLGFDVGTNFSVFGTQFLVVVHHDRLLVEQRLADVVALVGEDVVNLVERSDRLGRLGYGDATIVDCENRLGGFDLLADLFDYCRFFISVHISGLTLLKWVATVRATKKPARRRAEGKLLRLHLPLALRTIARPAVYGRRRTIADSAAAGQVRARVQWAPSRRSTATRVRISR